MTLLPKFVTMVPKKQHKRFKATMASALTIVHDQLLASKPELKDDLKSIRDDLLSNSDIVDEGPQHYTCRLHLSLADKLGLLGGGGGGGGRGGASAASADFGSAFGSKMPSITRICALSA